MRQNEKIIKEILENTSTFLDEAMVGESMARTWDRVETGMIKERPSLMRRRVRTLIAYGAAACLVMASVLGIYLSSKQHASQTWVVINNDSGSMRHVMLPDGSGVWLYYGSVISYPEQFDEAIREVNITGEAFFDVVKNEMSNFRVNSGRVGVTVLGTRFNIRTGEEDGYAEIVLESGSVEVEVSGSGGSGSAAVLVPGQMAVLAPGAESFGIEEVDVQFYTSWKDDYLNINSQTISNVCALLGKRYMTEVNTAGAKLGDEVFSGRFYKNQSLEEILDIISLTTNSRWEFSNGNYLLIAD